VLVGLSPELGAARSVGATARCDGVRGKKRKEKETSRGERIRERETSPAGTYPHPKSGGGANPGAGGDGEELASELLAAGEEETKRLFVNNPPSFCLFAPGAEPEERRIREIMKFADRPLNI
jgi:hypothetical protein